MGTTEEAINEAKEMGISAGNTYVYEDNEKGLRLSSKKRLKSKELYFSAMANESSTATLDSLDNLMED